MKHLVLVAAVLAACSKGKEIDSAPKSVEPQSASSTKAASDNKVAKESSDTPVDGVACDAKAVQALKTSFEKANGDDKAMKELSGKKLAFTGCSFDMQGNDMVYFKATASDATLECHMKGGKHGLDDFRHSAMSMNPDKMKLDIEATVGLDQDKRLALTDCEVTARDGA
jgi:hypothetical protein